MSEDVSLIILALQGLNTILLIASLVLLKDLKVKVSFVKNSLLFKTFEEVKKPKPTYDEIEEQLKQVMEKIREMK